MISVFSTLKEALFLWTRNFWYIFAIVMVLEVPNSLLHTLVHSFPKHEFPMAVTSLINLQPLVWLFLDAASAAAILGLLKAQPTDNKMWDGIRNSVRAYTWTLFRLKILIGLIAILLILPISLFYFFFQPSGFVTPIVTLLTIGLFLIFLKYALADPLVVVEQFGAVDALIDSWEMTKGRFVYVLGCYVFLGGAIWLIGWPLGKLDERLTRTDFLSQSIRVLLESLWVVVSWCMYLRIKAANQPPGEPIPTA